MLSNLSTSLVSVIYNFQLMRAAAENGIAAYGVVMYASFIATSIYLGYAIGINPIVGYHYGADNKSELHNLLTKSLRITGVTALSNYTAFRTAGSSDRPSVRRISILFCAK